MKNRRLHRTIDIHHLVAGNNTQNSDLEAGYLWFVLAAVLVMCFMLLSHLGIAS